jgi:hypothetical protein
VSLAELSWRNGVFAGVISCDEEALDLLERVERAVDLDPRFMSEANESLTVRQLRERRLPYCTVHLTAPRGEDLIFARDLNQIVSSFNFAVREPRCYYLSDLDFLSFEPPPETPRTVLRYRQTLQLIGLLEQAADHAETFDHRRLLVFLTTRKKLRVKVTYKDSELQDLPELGELEQSLFSPPHEPIKLTLFKTALARILEATPNEESHFRVVLKSFQRLVAEYLANYHLFVSEFSFETEKERLQERKRDYLLKINSVLNEIQNKLLAVPISLVLVGGQMRLADTGAAVLTNVVILIGGVVFGVLMLILAANQQNSISAIRSDIDARRTRWQEEVPSLLPELNVVLRELDTRYKRVRFLLNVVRLLVALGILLSVVIFLYFLPPVSQAVNSFFVNQVVPAVKSLPTISD